MNAYFLLMKTTASSSARQDTLSTTPMYASKSLKLRRKLTNSSSCVARVRGGIKGGVMVVVAVVVAALILLSLLLSDPSRLSSVFPSLAAIFYVSFSMYLIASERNSATFCYWYISLSRSFMRYSSLNFNSFLRNNPF